MHRDRGIHIVAGSGSGKSLTIGLIAFVDFLRGVPQVLFDPTGQMIDAFLMYATRFSRERRSQLWPKVLYVDMAAKAGRIPVWPLLHEYPSDSRQDIANRFLQTCRAIDPNLESASIQGFNALRRVGAPVGVVLSSLGMQLDQALDLLDQPERWASRLSQAEQRYPGAHRAAEFFRTTYTPLSNGDRLALSSSFRAKIEPILLDPSLTAMFCSSPSTVDFREVVRNQQTVLLDFRGETNDMKRLLKTRWAFDALLAFIRHRGPGRHLPLAIHFDEITELTNQASAEHDLFTSDLDYLFNVLQRNYACWITAAHQQMWQLSPRTQQTLLSLGTQMVGVVSDIDTAEALARQFAPLDPRRIKRVRDVWMKDKDDQPFIAAQEPVDFPMSEQTYVAAREFMRLKPFEFLVMPRGGRKMRRVNFGGSVGKPWPNEYPRVLAHIRRRLSSQVGVPRAGDPIETVRAAGTQKPGESAREEHRPSDTLNHAHEDHLGQVHDDAVDDPAFWDTSGEPADD